MHRYEFSLRITSSRYQDYYRGKIRHVVVECRTGQNVQFPAALLQKFVTMDGIAGNFVLTCDENHKCISLERIDPME